MHILAHHREQASVILDEAWATTKPAIIIAMFSGGYDSLVNTHLTMTWAAQRGLPALVVHLNTRTGVPRTHQFVIETTQGCGWKGRAYVTPERYEILVQERGFPGPAMHTKMYDRLKGRSLENLMREYPGQRVLLSTGVRQAESLRRMGYTNPVDVRGRQVWVNPCLFWTKDVVLDYKEAHDLPSNPVVDLLHRSGECNCGAMAAEGELEELEYWFPSTGRWLRQLEQQVIGLGYPWGWGEEPPAWWKKARGGQLWLSDPDTPGWMPLCVGCESRQGRRVSQRTPEILKRDGTYTPRYWIFQQSNVSVRSLTRAPLRDDPEIGGLRYHQQIKRAAAALAAADYKDYQYVTQYLSGTTVWRDATGEASVLVTVDGTISR